MLYNKIVHLYRSGLSLCAIGRELDVPLRVVKRAIAFEEEAVQRDVKQRKHARLREEERLRLYVAKMILKTNRQSKVRRLLRLTKKEKF